MRDVGHPHLDVVLERWIRDVRNGRSPLTLRQIASASSRTVVLSAVERLKSSLTRGRRLHRQADAVRQVAAVRVVADLRPSPRMWSGSWPLITFCTRSGTTWLIASLTLPLMIVGVAQRPPLADPDAVERPQDGVGQLVLLPGALGEVLAGELLEAVGRARRRAVSCGALGRREDRRRLEDHRAGDDDDPLETAVAGAAIAASKVEARIRSFSASRS